MMFHLVCFGWLLFRAESLSPVAAFSGRILTDFRLSQSAVAMFALIASYMLPLYLFEIWGFLGNSPTRRSIQTRTLAESWPAGEGPAPSISACSR